MEIYPKDAEKELWRNLFRLPKRERTQLAPHVRGTWCHKLEQGKLASSAASQTGVYVIHSGHTRPCLISMIPRDADRWLRSYPGIDPASFTSRIHICLRIHGTREASYTGSDQERKGMDKREGGVWVLP
jgi:hypothetical protein